MLYVDLTMKTKIKEVKIIDLLDVLYELVDIENKELGLEPHDKSFSYKLPDGRDNIKTRIWKVLCDSNFGNQIFCNDSYFRYPFNVKYGEDFRCEEEKILYEHCKDALNDTTFTEDLIFWVSW